MKKIRFFAIKWDTDGSCPRKLGLPTSIDFDVDNDFEPEMEGADLLSDKYGFCVHSFQFKEL